MNELVSENLLTRGYWLFLYVVETHNKMREPYPRRTLYQRLTGFHRHAITINNHQGISGLCFVSRWKELLLQRRARAQESQAFIVQTVWRTLSPLCLYRIFIKKSIGEFRSAACWKQSGTYLFQFTAEDCCHVRILDTCKSKLSAEVQEKDLFMQDLFLWFQTTALSRSLHQYQLARTPSRILYCLKFSRLKSFGFRGLRLYHEKLSREFFTHAICLWAWPFARALDGHQSRTACMLVPTGCRYRC